MKTLRCIMRIWRDGSFKCRVASIFILGSLCLMQVCSKVEAFEGSSILQRKPKRSSLAYGYNPVQNGSFATNNVLLPGQYLRGWDGWGVYLSLYCVIRLSQQKENYIKHTVWIRGPGLTNESATNCFAQITGDGDFNMYYSDGMFAASVIQHPWALKRVSSRVGYELMFIKDSLEWHHHMKLELRHYNWKVQHVTLWQDLLTVVD